MTSITVPRSAQLPGLSGIIDRPRLLEKLRAAPEEHKMTLISAPPGYGKTTLAAQFARRAPYPVAWQTIDERSRDVPNLHAQCLAALSSIAPGIRALTPKDGYSPGELAAMVADHLHDAVTSRVIYVLDDEQHLAGSPAAKSWLRTLVMLLPSSFHLVIISRMLPDLPFAEMIARREILAIGQEELRFTLQEIHDLAMGLLGVPIPPAEVKALSSRLEGWPAGTVLALHPLPLELERAMLSGSDGPEALFDVLAGGMLRSQPPDIRDFLLATSTLPRLTPELCSAALGLPYNADWLADAQDRNLFLSRTSGALVYHTLFRNFLQRELKASNADLFVSLHARAAHWFENQDNIEEALDHYLEAGMVEQAAALAERVAQAYFTQGRIETLLSWGLQLERAGAVAPRLLCTCAKVNTDRYDYRTASVQLDAAEAGFSEQGDLIGLADVRLQRAMLNLQRGDFQDAVTRAGELLDTMPASVKVKGQALRITGFGRLRLGEVEDGTQCLEEALPLHRIDGDTYALANLLMDLQVAYLRQGRFEEAAACLQEVVALRRSNGGAGALALALNNLGYHYHQQGEYREALATFQEGLRVIARVPNRRAESHLLWSMAELQRDRGVFDEAIQHYHKALEFIGDSEPAVRSAILIGFATLHRWQGRLNEASTRAQEVVALATRHNLAPERAAAQAIIWAAQAQSEPGNGALAKLNGIAADLTSRGARSELLPILALCAHVALLDGDSAAADLAMRSAADAIRQGANMHLLAAEIVHTPMLYTFVMARKAKFSALVHVVEHLRQAQLHSPRLAPHVERLASQDTYSLRVWTLGPESLERDGIAVPSKEWRTSRARELFLYLLFMGPQEREELSLTFWPESSSQQVRRNFHTTLYRARNALSEHAILGEHAILFTDGLYMVNPNLDVWCDAQQLEDLARHARPLPARDARTEDLWRRAADLYRGDFLPSLDAEWVYPLRDALREAYLEALIGLGECARARGDSREAIKAFKRALEVDPYREDIHQKVMICYGKRGDKQKIVAQLKELKNLLWRELAVEPSAETLALARDLLN